MGSEIVVERNVGMRLRDSVSLATDVYRPADTDRHPVLVLRLPYGRSNAAYVGGLIFNPLYAVERGYAVVVQDVRGRLGSEGRWHAMVNEAQDGYDAVEWAAEQPWSNGSVGIYGSSYMGVTALQAATANPPHLKAALAYLTGANYHDGWAYSGGAFELGFCLRWTVSQALDTLNRLDLEAEKEREIRARLAEFAADQWSAVRRLPVKDALGSEYELAPHWHEWTSRQVYDKYWADIDVVARADNIKVPLLHVAGWYDGFLRGHLDLQASLKSRSSKELRENHRFVIGPWDHEAYLSVRPSSAGQRDFGPDAVGGAAGLTELALAWFDHWLVEEGRDVPRWPGVRYFVMGENRWERAESWPPPYRPLRLYLRSGGSANTRFGDGVLSAEEPAGEVPDGYVYDPEDPVPTVGGRHLAYAITPAGVQDQAQVEERSDVLVYTTPPLTAPVTIAGPVTLDLFVKSSAPDTDFTAKLVDVGQDGFCANLAEGITRARYRNGRESEATFLDSEETVLISVDLWDVAHTFRKDHRIRIEISSSNFPRFDRNGNCRINPEEVESEHLQTATQTVFHDAERASHVTLPVRIDGESREQSEPG